jgi:hypothetical protein
MQLDIRLEIIAAERADMEKQHEDKMKKMKKENPDK